MRTTIDTLILAGGKSSRMGGVHKGRLKVGGETFVKHLIREMGKETDQIWISYGTEVHEEYTGCKIVMDTYKECGPMGGIHAGLTSSVAEYVFCVACDMPYMKAAFVEILRDYIGEDVDAVIPVVDGRIHPLAGIYKRTVLPVIEELLEQKNYKLRSIFEHVNVVWVNLEEQEMANMLRNINTMKDYEEM